MTQTASSEQSARPSATPPVTVEDIARRVTTRASAAELEQVKVALRQRLAATRQQHEDAVKRHDLAAMHQLLHEGRRLVREIHAIDALLAVVVRRAAWQAASRAAAVLASAVK